MDLPVTFVSWYDCKRFAERLNNTGNGVFRLPTEAEWEYACKGGENVRFGFGDDESELEDYAWGTANGRAELQPVGKKKPTAWGLHDMHGNAMEWCLNAYAGFGSSAPVTDPGRRKDSIVGRLIIKVFPELGTRVWKGGAYDWKDGCHCAYRSYGEPNGRFEFVGFRIAREES